MSNTCKKSGFTLYSLIVLVFTSAFSCSAEAQWTTDASGNIFNTNSGQVNVKSPASNAGFIFYVNPLGLGGMTIGEANAGSGGYTNLNLAISAYQGGYAKIQSIQSSGSAWGTLALNPNGGSVGIGTTTPGNLLEVATTSQLDGLKVSYNGTGVVRLHANSLYGGAYNGIVQNGDAGLLFGTNGTTFNYGFVIGPWSPVTGGIRITSSGNVLIGKGTQTNTSYVLDINGNARANQVVVNTTGADYVFDPGYRLSSLRDLETYVAREHHLPGIAPASQMQAEGIDLGNNQTQLLAKIEELTLYVIRQDKEIKTLKKENRDLEDIKRRLAALEQKNPTN